MNITEWATLIKTLYDKQSYQRQVVIQLLEASSLLWSQPAKTPRALDDPNRKSHEIDEHIKILVTDQSQALRGDVNNRKK